MPDVREELGRLAGEAGEPGGLEDLATARRRRERRRRTTSLVGGLGVVLLGVLVAVQFGRASSVPVPGDTSSPAGVTPSAVGTVWPENAVNGFLPSSVQAALDGGDDALRWRTDPKQVVERFGVAVLGRDMRIVDVEQLDDGLVVYALPCPPGDKPVGDGCDVGEQIAFHVIQPATTGEGGIWSVASVNSMPLAVTVLGDPVSGEVREGDDVTFDIGGLPSSTTAHIGIVVANGCNVVHAIDDQMAAGPARLAVPSIGGADPSCATSPGGFAFLYVTDDTTLPTTDPIEEPTAIEYPWISIVPFAVKDASTSSAPASTTVSSYSDPLGWTIDLPGAWTIQRWPGSGAGFTGDGITVEITRGGEQRRDDSAFPLDPDGFLSEGEGGLIGSFHGDGLPFKFIVIGDGMSPPALTPSQQLVVDRMIESVRFERWKVGETRNGYTAIGTVLRSSSAEWFYAVTGDGENAFSTYVDGKRTLYGPVYSCSGARYEVREYGVAAMTCADGSDNAWDFKGRPQPGNGRDYAHQLDGFPAIRSWDGYLLADLRPAAT